jgi:hypothetical protein
MLEPLTDRLDFFTWSGVWSALPKTEDMLCKVVETGFTYVTLSFKELFLSNLVGLWYYHHNELRGSVAQ